MKSLFIFIALLIVQLSSSQITLTKQQKDRLCDSLTAKRVLDISKGLTHERELDSVLKKRDSLIAELYQKISDLKDENYNYTQTILKLNNFILATSQQVDSISEKQIKNERKFWQGLHLAIGTDTSIPDFKPLFKTNLEYELNRWSFGVEATTENRYYITLSYKIF